MASSIEAHETALGTVANVATGRLHVKWFSAQGLLLHLVVLSVMLGCSIATWWQLSRALAGNGLSWAYTFEWPCFGVYAIVIWWKVLHEQAAEDLARTKTGDGTSARSDGDEGPADPSHSLVRDAATDEIYRAARQGGWHP